ncbi:MAG: glycosyl transferase family 2 [Nitrospirae bacterium GWC2_42_7]|nr:MAG: glycosyl transferase family 2 [Nitrospirae bacterium GWC2_42_7]
MTYQLSDFAIIIPAYNEAGRITSTIAGIRKSSDADIIVVNDGSDDNTAEEAKATGAIVLSLPFNLGYGAALQTGYKYALDKGYEFVVQMDADGQHDPAYILPLVTEVRLGSADVAIGSRFLGEGDYRPTTIKKIGMIFFRMIASYITGQKITDPTSGFQALNQKAMNFYASDAYPVDFPDADVLVMLHRKGISFKEIPVRMNHSTKKKTMHSGFVPLYYLFKMVLSIFVTMLRKD